DKTCNVHPAQSSDKEIVFPFGNLVSFVKRHPARRNDRVPVIYRLFQTFLLLDAGTHGLTIIIYTISDHRPSIICARGDKIDFLTAPGPKFTLPYHSNRRLKCQALW